ncbi:polysaccharide pyruvyl transferase CsaB [Roseofilum sp. BLCC_M91]|uniref:Polysaccharide pyruvyl transferase CsaB n=1 Tax=Roseofilum halophilum BLCC-M91 TaxID=3022259 RepID=A0ABT7BL06_9CYAN|nr:polysaccharide pyruvyl transferase CsaB [Roseofilum halophilum]MDJ1179750.1 polysaccharide pyruvyl transferase CsaB [Roseofilum halophilum BLCC-M91]
MRVVLCGYYGQGNAGDEALLVTLLQMLPDNVTPVVLSANCEETQQQYGVETCSRTSIWDLWRTLASADGFIWGGGSLIQDVTSWRSPLYYFALMALAQRMGKITLAWGQGIGPLNAALTRRLARSLFRGCTAVSVRDRQGAQLLTDWNIPHILAPDPVWALDPLPVEGLDRLPHPRIAVVLRPHPQLTADRLQTLTQALIELQQRTQSYLLLLPFQPKSDLDIAQRLHQALPKVSEIWIGDKGTHGWRDTPSESLPNRPEQYKSIFSQVEMAIAMRLHGLIMAAGVACPCFALSYDPKVTQLMEQFNLPGWELDQLPENPSQISQTWIEFYQHRQPLTPAQLEGIRSQTMEHQQLLHRYLSPNCKKDS